MSSYRTLDERMIVSSAVPALPPSVRAHRGETDRNARLRDQRETEIVPHPLILPGEQAAGERVAVFAELQNAERHLSLLRIGITHTSESNLTAAALARYSNQKGELKIILFTDTINNLYDMLGNYELDLAIVDGAYGDPRFSSMLLDTDYLTCVMSVDNPLARKGVVTLAELWRQKMILRTPASATRTLFESALESNGESIQSFDVTLEVDNIATIKDLIRKDLGVSILPRSACLDELRKGKIAALPVENLSMVRETRIVYNKDFTHTDMLNEIIKTYGSTVMN